jgi:hypothetical protein
VTRRGTGLLSGLLAVWLSCGCSGTAQPTRIVCGACEEPDRFVRLQLRPAPTFHRDRSGFAHPFKLAPEDWQPILASIQVQTWATKFILVPDKQPPAPAFTPDEIAYLGQTLSKAFADATAGEVVVFGLSHTGPGGVVEMTTGGWFVAGSSLHLVLANYHCAVTLPGIRERLTQDPLSPNTGGTFNLPGGPYQTVVRDSSLFGPSLTPGPSEVAIDYKPLLLARLPAAANGRGQAGKERAETEPARPAGLSIEESMALLKRLRDQGLITDAEYDAKKKQLLDRF